jgi:isopentenyl diphosphate isomerase/L-lactate dehydrogenase-like FMN-dependent dehydrogenase
MTFATARAELAAERLPGGRVGYFASGANDEVTLRENRAAFDRTAAPPARARDVGARDLVDHRARARIAMPVGIAPHAYQRSPTPTASSPSRAPPPRPRRRCA